MVSRPPYPTSKTAKSPVDWDKLEQELNEEEKEEKLEGEYLPDKESFSVHSLDMAKSGICQTVPAILV